VLNTNLLYTKLENVQEGLKIGKFKMTATDALK